MTPALPLKALFAATVSGAGQVAIPTLGYAAGFVGATVLMMWGAGALPETTAGTIGFLLVVAASIAAHSLFSAVMYRRLVPSEGTLPNAVWKLTFAWALIVVVAAILATAIVLFFSLIGSSLGVVSGEAGQDITDMTAQMRAGGTFYPLFALFLLTLLGVFWFTVRMMLFAVASASRGAVHVFRTWSWTKGHAFPMALGALVFIVAPISVLGTIAANLVDGGMHIAVSTGIVVLLQVPAAWLGHAFAAAVYVRLSPPNSNAG